MTDEKSSRSYHLQVGTILGVALILRLAIAGMTVIYHPDEVWQYLEPAYGLISGHWIMTWEFREGARSWLVPEVLSIPMWLGHVLAPQSQWHLILARAFLACLSLAIPLAFLSLGKRISTIHGLVSLFVGAFWVEIFYFAPHALADSIACILAFPAICVAYRMKESPGRLTAGLAGFLIALCFVIRFQLAPPLLVLSIWALWRAPPKIWLSFLGGSTLALGLDALANLVQGAPPFIWIARNLLANLRDGRAAFFGTEPFYQYLVEMLLAWKASTIILIPAIALGARRFPIILVMAAIVIVTHSIIPHKEVRFILFAQMSLIFLASIGTTDFTSYLANRLNEPFPRLAAASLPLWLMMSASVALSIPFKENWSRGRTLLSMEIAAGRRPDMCGVGVVTPDIPAPSYAFLNRPVPVYFVDSPDMAKTLTSQMNTLIAPIAVQNDLPKGYRITDCSSLDEPAGRPRFCTFIRPGGCSVGASELEYNHALVQRNM